MYTQNQEVWVWYNSRWRKAVVLHNWTAAHHLQGESWRVLLGDSMRVVVGFKCIRAERPANLRKASGE